VKSHCIKEASSVDYIDQNTEECDKVAVVPLLKSYPLFTVNVNVDGRSYQQQCYCNNYFLLWFLTGQNEFHPWTL
jgi:hypothetical protein